MNNGEERESEHASGARYDEGLRCVALDSCWSVNRRGWEEFKGRLTWRPLSFVFLHGALRRQNRP